MCPEDIQGLPPRRLVSDNCQIAANLTFFESDEEMIVAMAECIKHRGENAPSPRSGGQKGGSA